MKSTIFLLFVWVFVVDMFCGVQGACVWCSSPCANKHLNYTVQLPDWITEAFYAKEKLIAISIFAVNVIPFALEVKRVSHRHTKGQHCM